MSYRGDPPPLSGVLPSGALPCVWMSAGLVAFKLCDREGECEGCPFDRAMRGLGANPDPRCEARSESPGAETMAAPWSFPADRAYHRGHGWAKALDAGHGGRLRLGVDAAVARLWNHLSGVILPALGSRLAAGETACWLEDGPELLAIPSPAGGTVVARNGGVLADPGLIARSPYEEGWLFEVEEDGSPVAAPLLAAEAARQEAEEALAGFQAAAARALRRGRAAAGPTLADGGEPLTDLRAMLGPPRYAALARRHLSLRAGRRRRAHP